MSEEAIPVKKEHILIWALGHENSHAAAGQLGVWGENELL